MFFVSKTYVFYFYFLKRIFYGGIFSAAQRRLNINFFSKYNSLNNFLYLCTPIYKTYNI